MKLFSSSNRALTRDAIRVVNPRRLLLPAVLTLLVLNLATFAGGIWVGRELTPDQPQFVELVTEHEEPTDEHFAIDRLGVLIGRLKSLESDVLSLRRMLGEHKTLTRQVSALDPSLLPALLPEQGEPATGGQGGLLLPPRSCAGELDMAEDDSLEGLQRGEETARCLRGALDRLMDSVARRNAALMAIPSLRPVADQARLGSPFGNRLDPFNRKLAFHSGLDFSIRSGAAVNAAAGGRVRFAGNKGGYGKVLEIDHGNGLVTRYAHLSRFLVRQGEVVTPGQHIAAVGSTGRSTGPHLHFEVMQHGRYVDPQRFLALADMERDDALVHD